MTPAGVIEAAPEPGAGQAPPRRRAGRTTALALGLLAGLGALVLLTLVGIAVGSRSVPLSIVVDALTAPDGSGDHTVIRELRVPRTLLGLGAGAALGLAGALMQSLTRNPLADPGLLGVNNGAALGVAVALGLLGVSDPALYVWFAFAGAAAASVLVYALGSAGRSGSSPVRLALAGVSLGMVLSAASSAILRADSATFDRMRFWLTGSLAGPTPDVAIRLAPFLAAGLILGLALAGPLNALALGDEAGRALGAGVGRTRALAAIAVTLLCGSATAAAGPLWFVGLVVPHAVRTLTGSDQRWLLPYTVVFTPVVLLAADILGRVVARPGEVQVGIMWAVVGAPVFILLARRRRLAAL
ncbi:iron chelate uptake ABC transporter family permease subunit [Planomonospora sp. ID67723]|uniref:FecCD family ABC transporter permease n=1 Tax=Planomonospora sp. ID67723 TaxID=2738134 RepID=UPI0027DBFCF7|nr:iron chelate uptake ABC transporter family permease subunit [Planomonospora sp. ID67723]